MTETPMKTESEGQGNLDTVLRRLQAEYEEAGRELRTHVGHNPPCFTAINACGKRSGLARAIQIVATAIGEGTPNG